MPFTVKRAKGLVACGFAVCASVACVCARASDWPMWRGDAARSRDLPRAAASATELQWSRDLGAPAPAWPASQDKLRFDDSYEPVARGRRVFVPSMVHDNMTAYDTRTGEELWRFVTGGPVRFAGVAFEDSICFGSDDGWLYCLDSATGELRWKRRGGPDRDRYVIGNGRMVSTWSVRGAPVLHEGKIYFASGIWPFMGVFVHCLDARTGEVVWTNSSLGSRYTVQQHGSPAFAGVAPQGYLAATDDVLLVPGGRTVPAALDRRTGELRYFHLSSRALGKAAGGYDVSVRGDTFSAGGRYCFRLSDGEAIKGEAPPPYGRLPDGVRERVLAEVGQKDKPWRAIFADDRLFVTTRAGKLLCFGRQATRARRHALPAARSRALSARAVGILKSAGAEGGWCLVLGLGDGDVALDLAASGLDVLALDPDAKRVDKFRTRAIAAGLYGRKVSALAAHPAVLPPYFASLVTVGDASVAKGNEDAFLRSAFRALRPYGGAFVVTSSDAARLGLARRAPSGVRVERSGAFTVLKRSGPLAGAGEWTHQNADAANSLVSADDLVRLPLGLLWFGGPSNDEILPRHGHGPAPQVAGGRIVIEGRDMLRALDVYTGRLLWQRRFADVGRYYDNTGHHPGANEIGGNYVSLADSIYVKMPKACLRLDPATGKTLEEFALPAREGGAPARWGFVMVTGDLLVAAASPVAVPDRKGGKGGKAKGAATVGDLTPIVKPGETWRYLAGAHPDGPWTRTAFRDDGWKAGAAGFGYGDGDDRTVLDGMRGKYTVVYARKTFSAPERAKVDRLFLVARYDDAFIAYLNGKEVVRAGVGRGSGRSASRIKGHEAGKDFQRFEVPGGAALLREGANVIAVEGHNAGSTSSDFTLDPYLAYAARREGTKETPPELEGKPDLGIARALIGVDYSSASRSLVVMERRGGRVLWSRDAAYSFRHNAVVAGGGRIFCIDGMSAPKMAALKWSGVVPRTKPTLYALNGNTGRVEWRADEAAFGTWLAYSEKHDVLVQAGKPGRDNAKDESRERIVAFRGADGRKLWERRGGYEGPVILWQGRAITNDGRALELLTGKDVTREHPMSGETVPWRWRRNYGCNHAVGSRHMLLFRSAAAGYYDLARGGGTGNFGGFKSGCTTNLIAADGVLAAPEYTRTCACSYQNQTSLAMVHDPSVETWTLSALGAPREAVKRAGFNFGAPGDRLAEGGTLWLDVPSVGGPSPDLKVKLAPGGAKTVRRHSLAIGSSLRAEPKRRPLRWVAASGVEGVTTIEAVLPGGAGRYTVRLVFAEIAGAGPGERVFDVALQGKRVIGGLDIARMAGGANREIMREFKGVSVFGALTVTFAPKPGSRGALVCGMEIVREGGR
jgi:outer membrane protein assembly factor BamB